MMNRKTAYVHLCDIERLEARTHLSTTPTLAAPSALLGSASGTAAINLTWKDNAISTTTGYNVFRSTDGKVFTQLVQLPTADAHAYADTDVKSGAKYFYKINAYNTLLSSGYSGIVTVATQLGAPTNLAAQQSGNKVSLSWTDNDLNATAYMILRSSNAGKTYTNIGMANGAGATTYLDVAAGTGQAYVYEVAASNAVSTSAASHVATITTQMMAPSYLTATPVKNTSINLVWKNNDSRATGFNVMRSTDGGGTFALLSKITNAKATSYSDAAVAAGNSYVYEIQAFDAVTHSEMSGTATSGVSPNVAIGTRYGNETVVTAIGSADTILVDQNGSTLTVTANGTVNTVSATAGGLFIYLRGGHDSVTINADVTIRTTVDGVDGAVTTVTSASTMVGAWVDSTDAFSGAGVAHKIASFAGGVSKAMSAALANPKDAGATITPTGSLWGTGPAADDINQGSVGDCYFLSTLAAFAGTNPATLIQSAVDLGDGTYAVQFIKSGVASFVRVNGAMPSGYFNGFKFEHPGASGNLWGLVMEKAFAYFRTGANTYASISAGWMGDVYADLGVSSRFIQPSSYTGDNFYSLIGAALTSGKAVTLATSNAPDLVSGHAYTLISISTDTDGVQHYTVRNPWGVSGDSMEDAGGYATLTFAQLKANFVAACVAM